MSKHLYKETTFLCTRGIICDVCSQVARSKAPDGDKGLVASLLHIALFYVPVFDNYSDFITVSDYFSDIFKEFVNLGKCH